MTDQLAAELAKLTPEQRRLFLQRLRGTRPKEAGVSKAARSPADAVLPLSAAQERFWLLETLSPGDPAYTVPFAVRITGRLDRAALTTAMAGVLRRHHALRTVFVAGDPPGQRVRDDLDVELAWVDLSGLSTEARARELARHRAQHGRHTFTLTTGPLLAVKLVTLSHEDAVLLVAVHHIVFDAASVAVFVEDLAACYDQAVTGHAPATTTAPVQFADYCVWERENRSTSAAGQLAYWIDSLADAPRLSTLPLDYPRGSQVAGTGGQVTFTVVADRVTALDKLIRSERVTRYAALLTAFGLALHRANGQGRVLVGVPASTRTRPELQHVIGCFYNPQALRLDFDDDPTIRTLLHRAHRVVGQAYANGDVPFSDVVRAVRPGRTERHNPLFQCMLSLVDIGSREWLGGGVRFTMDPTPPGDTDMDLFVTVTASADGGLRGVCRYAGHFRKETVAQAIDDFTAILADLSAAVDRPVSAVTPARHAPVATTETPIVRPPYRPPGTAAERTLAAIWADVLAVDRVGIDDNFFHLGGDSMQVIQVIARAAMAGLPLRPEDLVKHPTIAGLATVRPPAQVTADETPGDDEVPVTPAQAWFLHRIAPTMDEPHHFNHPYYVELTEDVPAAVIAEAVRELVRRRDSLRLRLFRDGDGWRQIRTDGTEPIPFESHDLSDVPTGDQDDAAAEIAAYAQRQLSLDQHLVRAEHFRMRPGQPDRLLVICHHLAVDGLSRSLIMDDLWRALSGLPPAGPVTAFGHWARRLQEYAGSDSLRDQIPFWRQQARIEDLPVDHPGAVMRFGARAGVSRTLPSAATAALGAAARAAGVGFGDLLLTAVAQTIAAWQGGESCTLAVAAPGRQAPYADLDVTRTVGWFQFFYPLRLHAQPDLPSLSAARAVREHVQSVPLRGLGHGLLTHSCPDEAVRREMSGIAAPQVSFNYLGQLGSWHTQPAGRLLRPVRAPFGPAQDPTGIWPYLLDFDGELTDGCLRLTAYHSPAVHDAATVTRLIDEVAERLSKERS